MDPFSTLEIIGQPRLRQPLCMNMLGSDGIPTAKFLSDLDSLLREHAVSQICAWDMPSDLPGAERMDRWRLVSGLQKAIRRGDSWAAMAAAHACHEVDARYLFHRLAITAVEDVMLGNVYAVALTLALVGSKPSREIAGDRKTAVWLAGILAGGLKDHTACSLCALVDYDRDLHPLMREWVHLADAELADKAVDLESPIGERMLAAWLLAGTKRFRGENLPEDNDRPRWSLMRFMVQSGMPLILYYVADRAAMRTGDSMFVSVLPIWQMLQHRGERGLDVVFAKLPSAPMIGPILAPAYDCHTRDGRIALARFAQLPAIARYLEPIHGQEARLQALWAAVFAAEGAKLNLRVSSGHMGRVHLGAIWAEFEYRGLKSIEEQAGLISAIRDDIEVLHEIRRAVVASHHPGETTASLAAYKAPTRVDQGSYPILPGQGDSAFQGAPRQPSQHLPEPYPELDPARADYWLGGDFQIMHEPEPSPEALSLLRTDALAKLDELPSGETANTVATPLPLVGAPYYVEELNTDTADGFTLLILRIDALSALTPCASRTKIAQVVNGEAPGETPLVVVDQDGAYIYSGVETVIAAQLLGKSEVVVRIVRPDPSRLD